jgi:hypothetical protein
LVFYGVFHGFTERVTGGASRPVCACDERADRRAWTATKTLFDETLRA